MLDWPQLEAVSAISPLMGRSDAKSENNMATTEVKTKSTAGEAAIGKLVGQFPKEVAKRQWSAAAFASLITYLAEANGAKFANKEGRDAFRKDLLDSDFSFSSNTKKYLTARGFLPKADEYQTQSFE